MKTFLVIVLLAWPSVLLAAGVVASSSSLTEDDGATNTTTKLPEIVVRARRDPAPGQPLLLEGAPLNLRQADTSPNAKARAIDSADLLLRVPGAAVVRNGPQTGIAQLRGLSGDRVKVLVDGMSITPACPNHMDPPLHYTSPSAIDSLAVIAGVTPVSLGGDSIGGTILVQPPAPRFSASEETLWFGELGGFYRSSNDGTGGNGEIGVANQNFSASYKGSGQTGSDLRFPGGRVRDTGFNTQQHNLLAGVRTKHGVWSLDGGYLRTRDAGTPALPMDMIEDDGYHAGLKHLADYSFGSIGGRFFYHHIDHLMDNYSLRPPGPMRMFSPATSDDTGLNLTASLPRDLHVFRLGTGFHLNAFDAYQQNAISGAQQDTFNKVFRTPVGTFVEWQADWTDQWRTLIGLRNDTVISDADSIRQFFPPNAADAAGFNASRRNFTDVNFDVTAALRFVANKFSTYELSVARKNRAPGIVERYLWTPLSASAGQADGRTYLGNLDLSSETSHQVAFTADWHGSRWQVQVAPFYNFVSDYIQGAPIARLDVVGQPVLQFQNVSRVDLYGVDALLRYGLNEHLSARGSLSYVRGVNRDNDDNLYRIPPLRGLIGLEHRLGGWENHVEVVMVNEQDKVSAYNSEPTTPGYVLLNLRTGYTFRERFRVELGMENVMDEFYTRHLAGINRVRDSDVPLGARIPGAGRFFYVSAGYRF